MPVAAAIARWAYERTGFSEESPPGPAVILDDLVGSDRIHFTGRLSVVRCPRRGIVVEIPHRLPPERLCVAMGYAAAYAAVLLRGGCPTVSQHVLECAACDIIMPRSAVAAVVRVVGPRSAELAKAFVVPTSAAERQLRRFGMRLASGEYSSASRRAAAG